MKNLLKACYLLIIAVLCTHCSKEYELPQDLVVHDFVWKGLNAYYLHQDEIADLSDRRFSSDQQLNAYLNTFPDYNDLFSSLLISTDVKSTLIEEYSNLDVINPRSGFLNGMEFGIIAEPASDVNVIGYIHHILPNSDASTKNIVRGEFFNAVDGVQLTRTNFEDLLIRSTNTFDLTMVDFDGTTATPNTKIVSLEKQNYNYDTIFLEKTFSIGAAHIGYLMYHNDFSRNSIDNLNDTFLNFKNQAVNELVLDLRYNIGGGSFARNITDLASMITGQFTEDVFIKEQWNSKAQTWFVANQPDSLITKFPAKLNSTTDFNSLNLTDVYIVLNGNNFSGSSAIELLINSLNPHINVHIIGTNTAGNNTGAITLYNSEDYDFELRNSTHTVALQPIVLSFYNKNDQTYENGFTPNITLCPNEDILNLGVLGERSEPILDRVLEYVTSGDTGVNTVCNPNNYEFLYHSINSQREADSGVFIKQNLPNTN
ncbi:S41 family peptidase [uncultured Polaribacter sp.]|uniref:S41 family peptidase n=1 Tax=uncultured Polaribacter sp. TaxID=174711 RepID=UPI0026358216|nr:S41 family peptidase [uncultured Polaribacter sp.]